MTQFRKGGYASRPDSPGIMEQLSRGEFVITSMNPYLKWYLDAVTELNQLPDPWLRIWAIHMAQNSRMTTSQACRYVREQYWQAGVLRWSGEASDDLRATWRGDGLHAAWFDLQLAVNDLKRAVWQAIPKPVRDFYSRHERILYPCAAVSLLVLVLVGIFGPQFVD